MSTDVSEVRAAYIIALMMQIARTSETSVDIQLRTRQCIPEDSELHTRHREKLKSHNCLTENRAEDRQTQTEVANDVEEVLRRMGTKRWWLIAKYRTE
jgi:hypothetical protein